MGTATTVKAMLGLLLTGVVATALIPTLANTLVWVLSVAFVVIDIPLTWRSRDAV